ncbi:hypothetical protein SAMN05192558_110306 [Actinokineospora alba]|uniref:Uncharacterized protein n=1 Tax=Actinokineospora alba TaxID=504798 RepID=A0A1H0TZY2_9PSEU|nr:hypothetical protein [Actinokineospora alba]TDP70825.1 hypothetical protein C8E96_6454 [Actinokineospora alba]SDJ17460.1 hypothetical protein SAMN05421871_110306 [Actinokineospora alba]SDP59597.1 hypothetical protein SAMN05192558_110306 [Actinokineospora alba]
MLKPHLRSSALSDALELCLAPHGDSRPGFVNLVDRLRQTATGPESTN